MYGASPVVPIQGNGGAFPARRGHFRAEKFKKNQWNP
jgi:hypothetical protein